MKHGLIQKIVFLIVLLPLSGITLAHTGSHAEYGVLSGIAHSLMSFEHLIAPFVIGLLLIIRMFRRRAQAGKQRTRSM